MATLARHKHATRERERFAHALDSSYLYSPNANQKYPISSLRGFEKAEAIHKNTTKKIIDCHEKSSDFSRNDGVDCHDSATAESRNDSANVDCHESLRDSRNIKQTPLTPNFLTPTLAKQIIDSQKSAIKHTPRNLEEQAISLVGKDIYEKLIKGYTQKQWGKPCTKLPADIIRRIPVRFSYDNNYFSDPYQGIPKGGYTQIFEKLLQNCEVWLNTDFLSDRARLSKIAKKIIFTGAIDSYFDYIYGALEYRSLRFEERILECENYQGVAVMNFTDSQTPYTRIIEHKHFEFITSPRTILSIEYPQNWDIEKEPFYPINDSKNNALYEKYKALADKEKNLIFGGRLGGYKYYDMDKVIESALNLVERELK
ncbi:UDP-galactopyranose/dTDP-fucopyranose mutase family protein [Helicobacter sp. T3_23-1056]